MAVMQARQVRSNRNIATTLCLLAVVALMLGGCLLPRYRTGIAYDPQQAAFAREPGTASISGQAFLQKSSGVVVYAAGRDVILFPVTDYTSERIRVVYGNRRFLDVLFAGRQFETTDERAKRDVRVTRADARGRFEFTDLAAGAYFVETSLVWVSKDVPRGGRFYDRVDLADGQHVDLILSGL